MHSSWKQADASTARSARDRTFAPTHFSRPRRHDRFIGGSPAARLLEQTIVRAAAAGDSTVLVTGETGCGKEEVARAIHASSPRASGPFVAINCGAMAASLIESQLFGHEKGAFTGAIGTSRGVFRAADGGTVFLDEIGEMPLELQPRLLRALQEREVTPVGASRPVSFDARVVAASNRDLVSAVARGGFREDLLYRLNTIEIEVPPLRRRLDDLQDFVAHFSEVYAGKFSAPPWQPDRDMMDRFMRYHWPGNVRQLAQVVERIFAMGFVGQLPDEDHPPPDRPPPDIVQPARDGSDSSPLPVLNLDALQRLAVRQAMQMTGGHKGRAASLLGVHLNTMTRLVEDAMPSASRRRGARPDLPSQPR